MGILTIIGPIMVAFVADRIMDHQLKLISIDDDMVMLIFFAAAIVLSLLALFWLRHGWIAEEAKRKVGVVTFNNDVTIIGDGTKDPQVITGDKLNNYDWLSENGKKEGAARMEKTIGET